MNFKQTSDAQGDLNYILSTYILEDTNLNKNDSDELKKIVKKIYIKKAPKKFRFRRNLRF
mgnify:CR=1 FL=1